MHRVTSTSKLKGAHFLEVFAFKEDLCTYHLVNALRGEYGRAVGVLSDSEAARGVTTHSSGNHGAALALAHAHPRSDRHRQPDADAHTHALADRYRMVNVKLDKTGGLTEFIESQHGMRNATGRAFGMVCSASTHRS